jgi:hypothetical protein
MWGWGVWNILARDARLRPAENTKSSQRTTPYLEQSGRRADCTKIVQFLIVLAACLLAFAPRLASAAAPLMAIPGSGDVTTPTSGGATKLGSGDVSTGGDFTYTIPIQVPPGTKGMVPKLALTYLSSAGDGHLGIGWSLSGFSAITRCPRTLAQDGVHGGVNFDTNDRFCLDGMRLLQTAGTGNYGAAGSKYYTEINTFQKIVANGTQGNGPAYFQVWARDGTYYEYGNTVFSNNVGAQVLASGTQTVRVWALDMIIDTSGNYMFFTYGQNTSTYANGVDYYPTSIKWTGNLGAGTTTTNSVQFLYDTPNSETPNCDNGQRPDLIPTYQAGSLIENTTLLCEIKTFATTGGSSNLVFDYKLGYNLATNGAQHDELNSVTLCDTSTTNCLPPTQISWQGSRDQLNLNAVPNGLAQGQPLAAGDFNGDGLTDALLEVCPSSGGVIYYGSQTGSFNSANFNASFDYWLENASPPQAEHYSGTACFYNYQGAEDTNYLAALFPFVFDLNGDGFSDVIFTLLWGSTDSWASEALARISQTI